MTHIAAALQEYCISFHCSLVNQDFPLHTTLEEKETRWLSACRLTDLPSQSAEEQSFPAQSYSLLPRVQKKLPEKSSGDQARGCQEWSNDQLRSDGLRLFADLPPNSERSSFQHLTPSLKEDNDGWESSSHKAALSAHRGRCGDVVTGKAGCVSKQELPALCIAAQALQWYYSHPHLTSPLTTACLSPLSLPLSLPLLLF